MYSHGWVCRLDKSRERPVECESLSIGQASRNPLKKPGQCPGMDLFGQAVERRGCRQPDTACNQFVDGRVDDVDRLIHRQRGGMRRARGNRVRVAAVVRLPVQKGTYRRVASEQLQLLKDFQQHEQAQSRSLATR